MDEKPNSNEQLKKPHGRWFRLSPDRFVIGLLLAVCLLWLAEQFRWFGFNYHKGWTVLIAVAAIGAAALVMLLWWAVSLIFRWRFQFGIRSLLAFCFTCSIAVGWFGVEMKRTRRQLEAVEGIKKLATICTYDWQVDSDGNPTGNSEPPVPRWMRNVLGDDFFSSVVFIGHYYDTITDADLGQLEDLTDVRLLSLAFTNVGDVGLGHLKCLNQLEWLDLSGTQATDAALESLAGLARLRQLNLTGTKITDAGLARLKGLTQLETLIAEGTQITDAGPEHLKGLTRLTALYLAETRITANGLKFLKDFPQCKYLGVSFIPATHAGPNGLEGLTQLQGLSLSGKAVTDSGLERLKDLTKLRELRFFGTGVTNAGVKKLQQALPNCNIAIF